MESFRQAENQFLGEKDFVYNVFKKTFSVNVIFYSCYIGSPRLIEIQTQLAITWSKLTTKTSKQGVKYVQS